MPFPWELHLDRPYHHENWPLPERLTSDRSTDSPSEHPAAKLDETANKTGGAEKAADSGRKGLRGAKAAAAEQDRPQTPLKRAHRSDTTRLLPSHL